MLKITLLFTNGLQQALKLNTEQGKQAFLLLQSAYTAARYKENFNPDAADVKTIVENAENLLAVAEAIYRQLVGERGSKSKNPT
ncbi:hypothetical protein [Mucilaginibacter pocheonensis]|uniref:HEPN domain-containing protein n=1 Tax=Mucilaginibacter pocheonensis TaxID=398050 RepID=A0ABU1TG86_9SPHI|nr:hypothetical protein [Mucilaginibacter pocheonensis]MDR6944269.1 hypothetical protein [Mucilaginibacter pocheonensis]